MTKRLLSLLAGACLLAAPVSAQSVRWDMANEYGESSIHGQAQKVFAEKAAELTDGDILITNHFGGALGYTSAQQLDAVGDGALPIANTNVGSLAGIEPLFLLTSLPFLVSDVADAKTLWEVSRPHFEEVFARHGQVLLYASPWPPAGIWAHKPVLTSADLQGLKIRSWDASGTATLKAAGAAAIQLPWADVVPQLAAGGIEAVLTSAEGGVSAKFWEHLSDFSALNYAMSLNMTHVNKDEWDALSDAQRDALLKAAEAASDKAWSALDDVVASNYADMRAHGMTVQEKIDPAFQKALSEAGQGVYADWLSKVGDEGKEILDAYEAARH
ncbi:TRAP transporter substrate-binding protein [Frigidibacter sp. MR17.14]|uniref:TRAP transporter substrate-binding protein n=1 Tax=Frigidibacter sp. MR17.14 TaxID=3126509 RepID=UPI003012DF00